MRLGMWEIYNYIGSSRDTQIYLESRLGILEKIDYIRSSRDKLHLSGIGIRDMKKKTITFDHHVTSRFIWNWNLGKKKRLHWIITWQVNVPGIGTWDMKKDLIFFNFAWHLHLSGIGIRDVKNKKRLHWIITWQVNLSGIGTWDIKKKLRLIITWQVWKLWRSTQKRIIRDLKDYWIHRLADLNNAIGIMTPFNFSCHHSRNVFHPQQVLKTTLTICTDQLNVSLCKSDITGCIHVEVSMWKRHLWVRSSFSSMPHLGGLRSKKCT